MVGPRYHKPSATTPAAPNYKESPVNFKDAEGWKVASPQDAMLRGNWWEIFHQPELNELEQQLNINNQTIKVYFENYLAARAQYPRGARAVLPDSIGRRRLYAVAFVGSLSLRHQRKRRARPARQLRNSACPLDISWAPDLFGRMRNTVKEPQAKRR